MLAPDVARLRGTVEHDRTGLVVRAGEDAWVEAISRLASDPARRERWSRRLAQGPSRATGSSRPRFEEVLHDVVEESMRHEAVLGRGDRGHDAEQLRSAS